MMLMAAMMALEPYVGEFDPRTTSMRSTSASATPRSCQSRLNKLSYTD